MGAGGRVGMRGDLANSVVSWLARQDMPIFLVGGCVRDELRGMPSHDLDLAVDGDALALARRLANRFGGAYFALDEARGTGRAILSGSGEERLTVDAARFRGPALLDDLLGRDFTVNALAADVRAPGRVIDPLNGRRDLERRLISPVSVSSIRDDPLRALRAVRQAAELGFELAGQTKALIQRDGQALNSVASERVRDELARLLALPAAWPSLELLDDLGLLTLLFPELEPMRQLSQPPPHHLDAFDHALATVRWLEQLLGDLEPPRPSPERMAPGDAPGRRSVADIPHLAPLAPFAPRLHSHLAIDMGATRPRRISLKIAALLHDAGKPGARSIDGDGRIRYYGHADAGAKTASATMRRFRFNKSEIRLVGKVVQHHMRPLLLAQQEAVSLRAVYRFFRDTGDAGVDTLLHSLADHLATCTPSKLDGRWLNLVALVARMLEDYWDEHEERVEPRPLVDGRDIMRVFDLGPGPQIGRLLESVREAQVSGEVRSAEEALALVRLSLGG